MQQVNGLRVGRTNKVSDTQVVRIAPKKRIAVALFLFLGSLPQAGAETCSRQRLREYLRAAEGRLAAAASEGLDSFYSQVKLDLRELTPMIKAVLEDAGIAFGEVPLEEYVDGTRLVSTKFIIRGGKTKLSKCVARLKERLNVETAVDPINMILSPGPTGQFSGAKRELVVSRDTLIELRPDQVMAHEIRHAWMESLLKERKPSRFHSWIVGGGEPPQGRGGYGFGELASLDEILAMRLSLSLLGRELKGVQTGQVVRQMSGTSKAALDVIGHTQDFVGGVGKTVIARLDHVGGQEWSFNRGALQVGGKLAFYPVDLNFSIAAEIGDMNGTKMLVARVSSEGRSLTMAFPEERYLKVIERISADSEIHNDLVSLQAHSAAFREFVALLKQRMLDLDQYTIRAQKEFTDLQSKIDSLAGTLDESDPTKARNAIDAIMKQLSTIAKLERS